MQDQRKLQIYNMAQNTVPLSIEISVPAKILSGLNFDILAKVISRPSGNENIIVEKNIIQVAPAPLNTFNIIS